MLARLLKLATVPVAGALLALGALVLVSTDAEGQQARDAGADAAGKPSAPDASLARTPPDPPALTEREQWVFDLRWDRGDIYLLEVHKTDMGAPHTTARVMGRFALELFEGPTLIERVRFDFPMLGPEDPDAGRVGGAAPPRFEPKLRTRIGVLFPATKRGTRLELWDRARNVRMPLPWPPREGALSPDAGVP